MKAKEKYKNFDPAKGLKQFCGISETPMIQMEHLRQLDFPITRGISYERTVDEFLLQLETNDALRDLRNHKDMAVLLNEEGAMIREKGLWTLYFTPNRSEHLTLKPEAVDPDDIEMLEDLITAAVNEALRKVDEEVAASMSKMSGGFGGLGGLGF